jgi:hypothetical protein
MKSSMVGNANQFVRKGFALLKINFPIGTSNKVSLFEMASGDFQN